MSNNNKQILKISLIIYIIVHILSFLKALDIEGLKAITNFSTIYVPITTIILLVYASEKRNDNESICKIGVVLVGISIIIDLLTVLEIVNPLYISNNISDKIASIINRIASSGLSVCSLLALLGIIPSSRRDNYEKFKTIAILCAIIYFVLNLIDILLIKQSNKVLDAIESLLSHGQNIAEYTFIIFYLLNKNSDMLTENSTLQDTTASAQIEAQQPMAYNPMMQQQIPNQSDMFVPIQQTTQPMGMQTNPDQLISQPGISNPPAQESMMQQPAAQTNFQQNDTNNS